MPVFGLVVDGVYTHDNREFDEAPVHQSSAKANRVWLPYVKVADPAIDPSTQKLGPVQHNIVNNEVRRSRAAVALTEQEKLEHVIRNRGAGYQSGTLGLKGVQGDQVTVLGFWVDAVAEQLDIIMQAQSITPTAELQALLSMRAAVKAANPKPS